MTPESSPENYQSKQSPSSNGGEMNSTFSPGLNNPAQNNAAGSPSNLGSPSFPLNVQNYPLHSNVASSNF
jgi:hypothetical protein